MSLYHVTIVSKSTNNVNVIPYKCTSQISLDCHQTLALSRALNQPHSASAVCSNMACTQFLGDRHRAFCLLVKRNLLVVLLIVGAVIGFAIGTTINDPVNRITDPERKATVIMLIAFPGEIFMNMLRMIVLPLIVATIITAVSTVNPNVTGRIGIRTVVYYLSTLVLAAILGLILVLTTRPGLSGDHGAREENVQTGVKYRKLDSLLDMLRSVHLCYVFCCFVLFSSL